VRCAAGNACGWGWQQEGRAAVGSSVVLGWGSVEGRHGARSGRMNQGLYMEALEYVVKPKQQLLGAARCGRGEAETTAKAQPEVEKEVSRTSRQPGCPAQVARRGKQWCRAARRMFAR